MSKKWRPYHIPVVAEKGPSETEPRPVDTKPAGLEASTAGRPSDDCALQTHTASQSATAVPGADLKEHNTQTVLQSLWKQNIETKPTNLQVVRFRGFNQWVQFKLKS